MSRVQAITAVCGFLALVALAYFGLMTASPRPLARVLMGRGYAERGWSEDRLAARVRTAGMIGVGAAILALGLAVLRFVG